MMTFKRAVKTDAKLVAKIIGASFKEQAAILGMNEAEYPYYVAYETPEMVIRGMVKGDSVIIATHGSMPVGTVRFRQDKKDPSCGHVSRLAVLPKFRKKKLGRELMEYAENRLKKLGVNMIEIEIVAEFTKLRDYYKELGYVPVKTFTTESFPFEILSMRKMVNFMRGFIKKKFDTRIHREKDRL